MADRELFSTLVLTKWRFDPLANDGLPPSELLGRMDEFEDQILESLESAHWGAGVAVVTHNGCREWRFYTPDAQEFVQRFSESLAGFGPYPLELEAFQDPDWTALEELHSSAKQ